MPHLAHADAWIALLSLTAMEIVLGIDNIVFITILVGRLPAAQRAWARRAGLVGALVTRLGLLFTLSTMMKLTAPVLTVLGHDFSGRDLILLGGGVFLIGKATHEIHARVDGDGDGATAVGPARAAWLVVLQIMLVDVVFSLDSVITAVGMASQLWVMIAAMVIAVAVMLRFAGTIGDLIERHPSLRVLALSFLLLVGTLLAADGLGQHLDKAYIYFAMAFSLFVELLNLRRGRRVTTRPAPGP